MSIHAVASSRALRAWFFSRRVPAAPSHPFSSPQNPSPGLPEPAFSDTSPFLGDIGIIFLGAQARLSRRKRQPIDPSQHAGKQPPSVTKIRFCACGLGSGRSLQEPFGTLILSNLIPRFRYRVHILPTDGIIGIVLHLLPYRQDKLLTWPRVGMGFLRPDHPMTAILGEG